MTPVAGIESKQVSRGMRNIIDTWRYLDVSPEHEEAMAVKRHHWIVRRDPLGERRGAGDHGRQRPANIQRVPGVRAARRDVLLLPVRRQRPSRRWLTFGGVARRRAQLALRDDVAAGRERARLPRVHLSARRVARSGAATRRHPRRRWR